MLVKKRYLSNADVQAYVGNITRHLQKQYYKIGCVVGLTRGGLPPATMLSHYFDVPLFTLDVSYRDRFTSDNEENQADVVNQALNLVHDIGGMVLVMDDINDSGQTFEKCAELFNSDRVKYAALLEKSTSRFDCDFYGDIIYDEACNDWIVFPWEDWWHRS